LELLFYIALFCEILAMQISLTTLPYKEPLFLGVMKCLRYMGYILVSIKILYTRIEYKEFFLLLFIICMMGVRIPFIGRSTFLAFLFVYGMKGVNYKKLAELMCVWLITGILVTILGGSFGIIENWGYGLESSRPRFSLGYFYPSHAASAIFYAVLLLCYVLRDKLKLWHVIVIVIFDCWQYKKTDSRTGTVLIIAAVLAFYCLKTLKSESKKEKICRVMTWSFLISALISLGGAMFYDDSSPRWLQVNAFVNNRLQLAHRAVNQYGFSLLGQRIEWIGYGGLGHVYQQLRDTYNYVDCSYIKILLDEGVLFWIFMLVGFTIAGRQAAEKKDIYLCTALMFTAVYSIIEPRLCEIGFNPFILMLAVLIDYKGSFITACDRNYTQRQWRIR
jgi:hypothetical protein